MNEKGRNLFREKRRDDRGDQMQEREKGLTGHRRDIKSTYECGRGAVSGGGGGDQTGAVERGGVSVETTGHGVD